MYKIWYRHSGQPEIDEIPFFPRHTTINDEREITLDEGHYITHMSIYGRVLPSLSAIAPRLTHLQIRDLSDISQLQRYTCVFSIWCSLYIMYFIVYIFNALLVRFI